MFFSKRQQRCFFHDGRSLRDVFFEIFFFEEEILSSKSSIFGFHVGVSINNGTPKWMVYNGTPYLLMDDLGGKPTIFGNTHVDFPGCFLPTS